jgi:hypothetical protein
MSWKLEIYLSDGTTRIDDNDFDTEDEARNEYQCWLENWEEGREVLKLSGREYSDAEIEDYEVWEE